MIIYYSRWDAVPEKERKLNSYRHIIQPLQHAHKRQLDICVLAENSKMTLGYLYFLLSELKEKGLIVAEHTEYSCTIKLARRGQYVYSLKNNNYETF